MITTPKGHYPDYPNTLHLFLDNDEGYLLVETIPCCPHVVYTQVVSDLLAPKYIIEGELSFEHNNCCHKSIYVERSISNSYFIL